MSIRRILVVVLVCLMASVQYATDRQKIVDADDFVVSITATDDECYLATWKPVTNNHRPDSVTSGFIYTLYDHIVVSVSKDDYTRKSRCVILQDVPYSGYYDVWIEAGYSVDPNESKEEYQLWQVADFGNPNPPIIPDQNANTSSTNDDYDWLWNNHRYIYFEEGDNEIFFTIGNQTEYSNSVDFRSILIVPPPFIKKEPPFTRGSSNTIEWLGFDSGVVNQEVYYFQVNNGIAQASPPGAPKLYKITSVNDDIYDTTDFGGLEDGQTYGYYLESHLENGEIVRTETTFSTQDASPPGQVTIDSVKSFANREVELVWSSVEDEVSFVTSYIIYRLEDNGFQTVVDSIATIAAKDSYVAHDRETNNKKTYYRFVDHLTDPDAVNKIYQYRIDAVDSVRNVSTGVYSKIVINIPRPHIAVDSSRVYNTYYRGSTVHVYSNILDSLLPKEAHFLRFQAARDTTLFFEKEKPDNKYFFEIDSLHLDEQTKVIADSFDLTNSFDHTQNFVEGHTYYLRAQLEDEQGNKSAWSNSFYISPDCFPPNDISMLEVRPTRNEKNTAGWMDLSWSGASDLTSGIKEYIVYRKINNKDEDFVAIDTVTVSTYQDSFKVIEYNGDVTYCIGSIDKVGNTRPDSLTMFVATVRSQAAPVRELVGIPDESMIADSDSSIMYTNNDRAIIECRLYRRILPKDYKLMARIEMEDSTGKRHEEYIELEEDSSLPPQTYEIDLKFGQGKYGIIIHALFSDKSISVWTDSATVFYDETFTPSQQEVMSSINVEKNVYDFNICNYPNPFNLTTTIQYSLNSSAHVSIEIYNINGRRIKVLSNENKGQGKHTAIWDATDETGRIVSTGIYYYRINIEGQHGTIRTQIDKMLLVK